MPERRGRLLQSSAAMAAGTALSRITGLGRVVVLAAALGKAGLADAYNLANNTPNIVYELLLGGVLSATLVPLFVEHAERDDDEGPSAVVSVALVALVALTALAMVAAPAIVWLYAVRLPETAADAQAALAVRLLWLFLPQMVFYGLTAVGTALLNARRRFAAAAFAPVINNVVVIGALLVFIADAPDSPTIDDVRGDALRLLLLGLGTTAGVVAMTVALWPAVARSGWHLRWRPRWRDPAVRTIVRLSGWTFGYVATNQVTLFAVLALANSDPGNVSAYTYAFIFFQLPHGLVAVSLMTTIAPELASAAARGDVVGFRERFSSGAQLLVGLLLPASIGLALLARGVVDALLARGAFGEVDAVFTGDVLAWFAVGLVGFSVYLYALRAFYAHRDTRTPFVLNLIENGLNIVFALALVGSHGVRGLAAAYALAYSVAAVVALAVLHRRIGSLGGRPLAAGVARVAVASVAMGAAVWAIVDGPSSVPDVGLLLAAVGAGVAVYAAVSAALWAPALRR
jgi:putative peptidoglycan lipid II flippase